jgi:hypothetical protein
MKKSYMGEVMSKCGSKKEEKVKSEMPKVKKVSSVKKTKKK